MAYKLGLSPAAAADVTAVAALGSTPFSPACKAVAEAVMAGAALTAAPATTRLGERNAVFSMFIPKVIPDSVGSHLNEIIASRLQKIAMYGPPTGISMAMDAKISAIIEIAFILMF